MRISLGVAQIIPQSASSTIAATIQQVEGYIPPNAQYPNGSLAYQNNNPGNLRYVGQAGATQGVGGFAAFPTYDDGLAALQNQIQIYAGEGLTIQQMMNIYAPASDGNNPSSYANTIASALGVPVDTPLQSLTASQSDSLALNLPTDADSVDTTGLDLSSIGGLDFTDPTTLAVTAAVGLAVLYFATR